MFDTLIDSVVGVDVNLDDTPLCTFCMNDDLPPRVAVARYILKACCTGHKMSVLLCKDCDKEVQDALKLNSSIVCQINKHVVYIRDVVVSRHQL